MMIVHFFRRFSRRDDGGLSVETVLAFPILVWAFGAMLVFWDGFSLKNASTSATYAIADLISRQTEEIDDKFIEGTGDLFAQIATGAFGSDIRVTVIRHVAGADPVVDPAHYELAWSDGTEGMPGRTSLTGLEDAVPLMPVGASMILVETRAQWLGSMAGFTMEQDFMSSIYTVPRYVPQIVYKGADTGNGNSGA